MNCQIFVVSIVVFVACLAIAEGKSLEGCRCIITESRRIGKHIEKVELFPPNIHCNNMEIIATLKETKKEVCLDPSAPWVKKILRIIDKKSP
ncbi:interleukin-8 [Misgurnus anguillicaudatus]|uniref:interleukin-8 n=1 Tax=Misgurnus anguillicaudatus TaxID=75329 RepID=UPI003CCF50ED